MLPSGNMKVMCSLDGSMSCEETLEVQHVSGLDAQGSPLPIVSFVAIFLYCWEPYQRRLQLGRKQCLILAGFSAAH